MISKRNSPDQLKSPETTKITTSGKRLIALKSRSQELLNISSNWQYKESQTQKAKQFTLKQLLNIVDKQTSAITSSRFFNLKNPSRKKSSDSKVSDKSSIAVQEKFVEEQIGETARIRLVRVLSFNDSHRQQNISNKGFKLNIQNPPTQKPPYKQFNLKICSNRKNQTPINNSILETRNKAKSIYQKISNVSGILSTTDRKVVISYSDQTHQLKVVAKKNNKTKICSKFRYILREIIEVVRYMRQYKQWFCYPITFNKSFLQKIEERQYDQVKNELVADPYLIHIRNQYGQTPLHIACIQNSFSLIKLLIQYGCNINSLDSYQLSPLYYTIQQKSTLCLKIQKFLLGHHLDKKFKLMNYQLSKNK